MITLFSTPKPFRDHFDVIQRNAIRSWTMLRPRPEIILLDDVEGAREVAAEFGLCHIPNIERNEHGTPLVRAIFETGARAATQPVVCYINCDMMLLNDFVSTTIQVKELFGLAPFLLIGGRKNVPLTTLWDFTAPDWEGRLRDYVTRRGWPESLAATDYFIFPKEIEWGIPDFAIGRSAWDGWFLFNARQKNVAMVDATSMITALHQQHDYTHWVGKNGNIFKAIEFRRNQRLRGSFARQYNICDSNYILHNNQLSPAPKSRVFQAWRLRSLIATVDTLQNMQPYSTPVIALLKGVRRTLKATIRLTRAGRTALSRRRDLP